MGRLTDCKDCDAPITFIEGRNGKWIPVDPGTENRHRCQLDQNCQSCGKPFKGANWMKTCPDCYRTGRTVSDRNQAAPAPARKAEALTEADHVDDDIPPF
jgi:hypothetical protein